MSEAPAPESGPLSCASKEATRFWSKVDKSDPSRCWRWTGATQANGYGRFRAASGQPLAHRYAHELTLGPIAAGMCVCHRCDTPACVNPAHLFVGTHADNMRDRSTKGRQARGSRHGCAKLDEASAVAIRGAYVIGDASQRELAAEYGVTKSSIGRLVRGENWSHA